MAMDGWNGQVNLEIAMDGWNDQLNLEIAN